MSKFQVLSSPSISVSVDYSTSQSFGDFCREDIANKREGAPDGSFPRAAGTGAHSSVPDFSESDDIEVLDSRSRRRLFEEDEYDGRKKTRYNFRTRVQPLERFNPAPAISRKKSKEEKRRRRELEDDAGTPLRAPSVLDGEDNFEIHRKGKGNGRNVLEPAGYYNSQNERETQTCNGSQLNEEKSNCSDCQQKSLFNNRADEDGFDDDFMIIDSIQASSSFPASKRKTAKRGRPRKHDRKEKRLEENGSEGADKLSEYQKPCDWPQTKSLVIIESKPADNDGDEDEDFIIIDSIQASPSFPASKNKTVPEQQKRTNKSKELKVITSKSKVSRTGSKFKEPKISKSSKPREPNAKKLSKPSKSKFNQMRLADMLSGINDKVALLPKINDLLSPQEEQKKLGDVPRQIKAKELTDRPLNAEPRQSKPLTAHPQEPVYIRPTNNKPVSTHERQNAVYLEPPKPARKPETSDKLPSTHEQLDTVHMKPPKLVQRPESVSLRASNRPDNDQESKRTSHLEQYSSGSSSNLRTKRLKSSPLRSKNAYSPVHKAFARDYNDPLWSKMRQDFSLPFAVGRKRKLVQETSNDTGKCKKAAVIHMLKEEEQKSCWSSQPAVRAQVKNECVEDPEPWSDSLIAARRTPTLNEFSTKLEQVLKKPFSRSELFEKLSSVRCQKPIIRSRDLRGERSISFSTEKDGPSYLDYHPGFAEMLNSASKEEERLKLLRGFLFWIEHACMAGSFQPWMKVRTCETEEEDCFQVDDEVVEIKNGFKSQTATGKNYCSV